jgi:hypothetical protein
MRNVGPFMLSMGVLDSGEDISSLDLLFKMDEE